MLNDAGMHRRARRVVRIYAQKAQNSAASAAKPTQPFWANWGKGGQAQGGGLGVQAQSWWQNMHTQARNWKPPKWEMPVHVDVDVLNPLVLTVRKTLRDVWVQLPPPVQLGLPYAAAGATAGLIVHRIQRNKLVRERLKSEKLQTRLDAVLEERNELNRIVRDLKGKARAPRSASEMQMAAAVAEATHAAAAAAQAAASAASRCSVQAMPRKPLPSQSPHPA